MHPKFGDSCVVARYFWRQLRTRTLDLKTVAHLDTGFEDSCVFWTQGHIWAQALDSPNEKSNAPPPPEQPIRKKSQGTNNFPIFQCCNFPHLPISQCSPFPNVYNLTISQCCHLPIFQCCNFPMLQSPNLAIFHCISTELTHFHEGQTEVRRSRVSVLNNRVNKWACLCCSVV